MSPRKVGYGWYLVGVVVPLFVLGHLPDVLSLIHVTRSTPVPAIIFECLLSLAMLMVKDVYKLINYLTFAEFLFVGTCNSFAATGVWVQFVPPWLPSTARIGTAVQRR